MFRVSVLVQGTFEQLELEYDLNLGEAVGCHSHSV